MNVILSHPQDKDAIWLYLSLQKNDIPVEIISPEELLMADTWIQEIDNDNDSFYIKTKKGIELTNDNLNFVFNRTQMAQSPIWEKANNIEKQYVGAEMNALLMSWLYQVQLKTPVYNPSIGYSLSGVYWSSEQWFNAAYKAGFENITNEEQCQNNYKNILIFGKKVISNCYNKTLIEKCLNLSKLSKTPLLEIKVSSDEKQFISANTFPLLQPYGHKLIAIIKHLINEN